MYASSIVQERIEEAQKELKFDLQYHSVADVDKFGKDLEQKYAKEYEEAWSTAAATKEPAKTYQQELRRLLCDPAKPRLSAEEVRWMLNEQYLSMCDARYWMMRYYWIKNIRNEIQRFTFRPAQQVYLNIVAKLEERRIAIEILFDKARQLGLSTETEGFIIHRASFGYGTNATIASYDQSKTAEMAKMLFLAYDMMPWWMRPTYTRRVESDRGMLMFGAQRSGIGFQHGKQTSGISQGTTPTVYHLSEVAYYPDPLSLIEVGLFKAVHPSPKVFGVLESTAAGDTGWWPDKYWYYKKHWPKCRMFACFLPWYLGTDLYPNPTFLEQNPVPSDFAMIDETREMIARAELYVDSNELLRNVLNADGRWGISKEQAWWWQTLYLEARDGGKERTFFQEYPTDDRESFQGSYDSVFGRETIAQAYSNRETRYAIYGIIGQSIEEKNEPSDEEIDWTKQRVTVKYESKKGQIYHWELVPLRWMETWDNLDDIREAEIPNGFFMVFRPPEMGYDYSIGVDTSSGVGDEATVIAVCRRAKREGEPDIQVAEFRSNLISHVEAYAYALAIAAYYARYMPDTTAFREPYVSVEQVAAVGDTVQLQMDKMGYTRFHRMIRYDSNPKDMKKSKSRKRGWFTYTWSRPILTDSFVVAVQNGWYEINSPFTIWECAHWEVHLTSTGKEKKVHSEDATDDGIFANAMAFFCPNDLKSLTQRTSKKYMKDSNYEFNKPPIDLGEYVAMNVSEVNWRKM